MSAFDHVPGGSELVATAALRRTARHRADLYRTLIALEQAAARPATGREADWLEGLREASADLADEIEAHVAVTEGPEGLYAEVAETAPRLSRRLDELRGEHVVMRVRAARLGAQLAVAEPTPEAVERARVEVASVLAMLVKHRHKGSDLVWEAYALDIGGVE